MYVINTLQCFFGIKCHVALDRNLGPGYNNLLLWLTPGDILSACPHKLFHTLLGLLDSRVALSNSNPYTCMPSKEGAICTIFMIVFCKIRHGCETHHLTHDRQTVTYGQITYAIDLRTSQIMKNAQMYDIKMGSGIKLFGETRLRFLASCMTPISVK